MPLHSKHQISDLMLAVTKRATQTDSAWSSQGVGACMVVESVEEAVRL
jgi:hypothetical protein